jgi:KaiC/GvpD/RAD55 family RecA-like ATPase
MNMAEWRGRGRPKKRWIDCVIQDIRGMDVSDEMTDRREWKRKTRIKLGQGHDRRISMVFDTFSALQIIIN